MTEYTDLNKVLKEVDTTLNSTQNVKLSILFANNTSGKTRLSKLFCEKYGEQALCYNAFLEDMFHWDNGEYILKISKNSWISRLIESQGIDKEIIDNFQKFTNSKIEPKFNKTYDEIIFKILSEDINIKISKGEESLFIWAIFYTILDSVIDNLSERPDNRSTNDFDSIKYIVIDDPVSSMDDTRIITIAVGLIDLINKIVENQEKLESKLKIFITTHHSLFFNTLHSNLKKKKGLKSKDYVLSRSENIFFLDEQKSDSPFAYHNQLLAEIKIAIDNNNIQKYHFNLFRCILEKTANFLGYGGGWSILLANNDNKDLFIKILNHYSHSQLSETEPKILNEDYKKLFIELFNNFIKEYKWSYLKDE